jgi:hypothetical protein
MLSGIRTKLSHDFEAQSPAPGGGADSWVKTASGLNLLIEVSGVSGRGLIGHELEPVVRHLNDFIKNQPGDAAALLVAPEFDRTFMAYLLVDARHEEGDEPPAYVVPLRSDQVQRLLAVDAPIDGLVDSALKLLKTAAVTPSKKSGEQFLADVEQLVVDHCSYGVPSPSPTLTGEVTGAAAEAAAARFGIRERLDEYLGVSLDPADAEDLAWLAGLKRADAAAIEAQLEQHP